MKYLFLLVFFVTQSAHSDTFIVNADNLNFRLKPSKNATVVSKVKGGKIVSIYTPEEKIDVEGYTWQKVTLTSYKKEKIVGWVASDYIVETSLFQPYKPKEPKALTFPLIDFETAYLLTKDGKFSIVEPEKIDGNFYGCSKDSLVIDNFCIQKGGELFIAKDLILAKKTDGEHKAFRLKSDGAVCTFLQSSLEPGAPDFRTCSTDRYIDRYTKLAGKF